MKIGRYQRQIKLRIPKIEMEEGYVRRTRGGEEGAVGNEGEEEVVAMVKVAMRRW